MAPTRDEIIERIRGKSAELRDMGATSLYIFGSRARGDARPDSDLDVFIDFDPERLGFVELMKLEEILTRELGIPVDLATRDALNPLMRSSIEASATRVL